MKKESPSKERRGIDRQNPAPLHQQIKECLLDDMRKGMTTGVSGEFGDETLMRRFGVSRMTVRAAVEELVRDGLLRRVRGRGTFIVSQPPPAVMLIGGGPFSHEWGLAGFDKTLRILEFCRTPAPPLVAAKLHVPVGGKVLSIRRIRFWNNRPAVYDLRYIPSWCSAGITRIASTSELLFPLIEKLHGVPSVRVEEELGAECADKSKANILQIPEGTALLRRQLTHFDTRGRPFITGLSLYPPGSARFKIQVSRSRLS